MKGIGVVYQDKYAVEETFQYEVIKTGKIVFVRDEAKQAKQAKRIRYEAQVLSSYLDYKETSDWLDREFLAKV